jgi:hypothetical protein
MAGGERGFAARCTALYALLALALAWRHEPWRDELTPWRLALEHPALGDFYTIVEYGGHPRLWHTAVWLLSQLGDDHRSVQAFQLAIAVAGAWLAARFAPFSRPARAALVFGYFPLFEYGVIARPYGLGLLLAFASFALFVRRPRAPLALAAVLGLVAQISVYHVLLACALALAFGVELAGAPRAERPSAAWLGAAAALLAAALAASLVQIIPPAAAPFAAGWRLGFEPQHALGVLRGAALALLPLPPPRVGFWNRHLLDAWPGAAALLGLALVAGGAWVFRRPHPALALWLAGSAAYLTFAYLKFASHARHFGVLFVLFVGSAWLASAAGGSAARRVRPALAAVLAVQLCAGLFAAGMDLALPFSASRDALRFLRAHATGASAIVGDPRSPTAVLAAELPLPLRFARPGPWLPNALVPRDPDAALAAARAAGAESGRPALLLLGYELAPAPADAELLASFARSIARERYWVYQVRPD